MSRDLTIGIESRDPRQRRDELRAGLNSEKPTCMEPETAIAIREDRPAPVVRLSKEVPLEDLKMTRRGFKKTVLAGAAGTLASSLITANQILANDKKPELSPEEKARQAREVEKVFDSKVWAQYEDAAKRPDLINAVKEQVKQAVALNLSAEGVLNVIQEGLAKTTPETTAVAVRLLSVNYRGIRVISRDDITNFFNKASILGKDFTRLEDEQASRQAHFEYVADLAYDKDTGFFGTVLQILF